MFPAVEQSAKCHLSTCALMINTILMVSINFLLHHQKAAVAPSLSQPRTCFWKLLCGSCWLEIVRSSLPHTHNFAKKKKTYQACICAITHQYLTETYTHTITRFLAPQISHACTQINKQMQLFRFVESL